MVAEEMIEDEMDITPRRLVEVLKNENIQLKQGLARVQSNLAESDSANGTTTAMANPHSCRQLRLGR